MNVSDIKTVRAKTRLERRNNRAAIEIVRSLLHSKQDENTRRKTRRRPKYRRRRHVFSQHLAQPAVQLLRVHSGYLHSNPGSPTPPHVVRTRAGPEALAERTPKTRHTYRNVTYACRTELESACGDTCDTCACACRAC